MILKELRISRHYSQEQLAEMSGLNVRTIQRIESGKKASLESLKCLSSVLEVDLETLKQEKFMINRDTDNWKNLPLFLKLWFSFNFLQTRPTRRPNARIELISHISGYLFCIMGISSSAALVGGLIMLTNAYLFHFLIWQGDKYAIWYDSKILQQD